MLSRRRGLVIAAVSAVALLVGLAVVTRPPTDVVFEIRNRTVREIPLLRVDSRRGGWNRQVGPVPADRVLTVRVRAHQATGESQVILSDPGTEETYTIVGYYEGGLQGMVQIEFRQQGTGYDLFVRDGTHLFSYPLQWRRVEPDVHER